MQWCPADKKRYSSQSLNKLIKINHNSPLPSVKLTELRTSWKTTLEKPKASPEMTDQWLMMRRTTSKLALADWTRISREESFSLWGNASSTTRGMYSNLNLISCLLTSVDSLIIMSRNASRIISKRRRERSQTRLGELNKSCFNNSRDRVGLLCNKLSHRLNQRPLKCRVWLIFLRDRFSHSSSNRFISRCLINLVEPLGRALCLNKCKWPLNKSLNSNSSWIRCNNSSSKFLSNSVRWYLKWWILNFSSNSFTRVNFLDSNHSKWEEWCSVKCSLISKYLSSNSRTSNNLYLLSNTWECSSPNSRWACSSSLWAWEANRWCHNRCLRARLLNLLQ